MSVAYPSERRRLLPLSSAKALAALPSVRRESWGWYFLIAVLDVAAWTACFGAVFRWRAGGFDPESFSRLVVLGLWPLAAILLMLFIVGGYDRRTDMLSLTYMSEHLIGMGAALIAASVLVYCFASYAFPVKPGRGTLVLCFVAFTPVSLVYRRTIGARVRADMARQHFLVLGTGRTVESFFETYRLSKNRQTLRFIDIEQMAPDGSVKSREDEVIAELGTFSPFVEGIVVTLPLGELGEGLRDRLVRIHFQQMPVYTLDTFYETFWRRIPVLSLNPSWPLQLGFQLARSSPYQHIKRLFDVITSAIGLIVLSPLLALITLLVFWDSGRPIIFRQERVGRGSEPFTIYKFRSMKTRVPTDADDLYTRTNDVRITRVGKWLRKLRLDELPQLWNVIRGDMSLIGPRAEWVRCAEIYENKIPSYHFRHLVKPGITGWAQVNYSYGENEEDALQKLKYDLYYIRRYSFRLDAMIVLKTLHIMFWGKGQ